MNSKKLLLQNCHVYKQILEAVITSAIFKIFSDILIDGQILFSPQGKRSVIISNKHGTNKVSNKLPNYLRLMILESKEILGNS